MSGPPKHVCYVYMSEVTGSGTYNVQSKHVEGDLVTPTLSLLLSQISSKPSRRWSTKDCWLTNSRFSQTLYVVSSAMQRHHAAWKSLLPF